MKALPLTATVLAAAVLLGARPGFAADLDYESVPPPDRYGSAYEDPRYRDLYAPEPPRAYRFEPRPYAVAPPPPGALPPRPIFSDRFDGWGPDRDWRFAEGCLPRHEIRGRLQHDGWHGFHDIEVHRSTARVSARRANGDLFRLKVDRCNGDVLQADMLDRYDPGPFAWRHGPRAERRFD